MRSRKKSKGKKRNSERTGMLIVSISEELFSVGMDQLAGAADDKIAQN